MGFKLYASKLCTREEIANHIYTDLSLLMPAFFINLMHKNTFGWKSIFESNSYHENK